MLPHTINKEYFHVTDDTYTILNKINKYKTTNIEYRDNPNFEYEIDSLKHTCEKYHYVPHDDVFTTPTHVYRVLRDDEDIEFGLMAKDPSNKTFRYATHLVSNKKTRFLSFYTSFADALYFVKYGTGFGTKHNIDDVKNIRIVEVNISEAYGFIIDMSYKTQHQLEKECITNPISRMVLKLLPQMSLIGYVPKHSITKVFNINDNYDVNLLTMLKNIEINDNDLESLGCRKMKNKKLMFKEKLLENEHLSLDNIALTDNCELCELDGDNCSKVDVKDDNIGISKIEDELIALRNILIEPDVYDLDM